MSQLPSPGTARPLGEKDSPQGLAAEIAGDDAFSHGALPKAAAHWREALEIYNAQFFYAETARVATKLADAEERLGDGENACTHYGMAAEFFKKSGKPYRVPTCLNNQAMLLKAMGKLEDAACLLERALKEASSCHSDIHTETALLAANLGTVLYELGDLAGAEQRHMQALVIREQLYGATHPDVGLSLGHLAVIHQMHGNIPTAKRFYESSLAILDEFPDLHRAEREVLRENFRAL